MIYVDHQIERELTRYAAWQIAQQHRLSQWLLAKQQQARPQPKTYTAVTKTMTKQQGPCGTRLLRK